MVVYPINMNPIDYLKLLRENDLSELERPPDFNGKEALQAVQQFRHSLEVHLGFLPVLDDSMQDTTHFAELELQPAISNERCSVIRFSKFGKLVTILFPEKTGNEKLSLILHEFQTHGYVYVPAVILESPYNGRQSGIGISTWMQRFFHYV